MKVKITHGTFVGCLRNENVNQTSAGIRFQKNHGKMQVKMSKPQILIVELVKRKKMD